MLLIPDAERWRRVLWCGALLALVTAQALRPEPRVEAAAARALAPLSRLMALLARYWTPAGGAADEGAISGAAAATAAPSLASLERRHGQPPPVGGLVWLEVPVSERRGQRLILGAGHALGLGDGQPVVYGSNWIGRVQHAAEQRAEVQLWTASGTRTGARLLGEDQEALRAVCEGSGEGAWPIVMSVEPRVDPLADQPVSWRGRIEDPPALEGLGLRLGVLRRRGDEARGEAHWTVEPEFPVGAEGRVYVAAGALPQRPAWEPLLQRAPVRPLLAADAVLGRSLWAVWMEPPGPAAALARGDEVAGAVVERRGGILWARAQVAAEWREQAVVYDAALGDFLAAAPAAPPPSLLCFTRGGVALPRGLRIPAASRRAAAGEPLEAVWR